MLRRHAITTEPEKVFVCGLVNFVPADAYLFCLSLPAAFSQPHTETFFRGLYVYLKLRHRHTSAHSTSQESVNPPEAKVPGHCYLVT